MFLVALVLLVIYGLLISIASLETTPYRTHILLNKAAVLVLVVSGILLGSAISEAWL